MVVNCNIPRHLTSQDTADLFTVDRWRGAAAAYRYRLCVHGAPFATDGRLTAGARRSHIKVEQMPAPKAEAEGLFKNKDRVRVDGKQVVHLKSGRSVPLAEGATVPRLQGITVLKGITELAGEVIDFANMADPPVPGVRIINVHAAVSFAEALETLTKLPTGKDETSRAQREKLFQSFDGNGNGQLSLAEVDAGIIKALRLESLFAAKPAIMRAFQVAKGSKPSKTAAGNDTVGRGEEFRLLLLYLARYFELFGLFQKLNTSGGDKGDKYLEIDEVEAALPELRRWGVEVEDPRAVLSAMDADGSGRVGFDEFAHWALTKRLQQEGVPLPACELPAGAMPNLASTNVRAAAAAEAARAAAAASAPTPPPSWCTLSSSAPMTARLAQAAAEDEAAAVAAGRRILAPRGPGVRAKVVPTGVRVVSSTAPSAAPPPPRRTPASSAAPPPSEGAKGQGPFRPTQSHQRVLFLLEQTVGSLESARRRLLGEIAPEIAPELAADADADANVDGDATVGEGEGECALEESAPRAIATMQKAVTRMHDVGQLRITLRSGEGLNDAPNGDAADPYVVISVDEREVTSEEAGWHEEGERFTWDEEFLFDGGTLGALLEHGVQLDVFHNAGEDEDDEPLGSCSLEPLDALVANGRVTVRRPLDTNGTLEVELVWESEDPKGAVAGAAAPATTRARTGGGTPASPGAAASASAAVLARSASARPSRLEAVRELLRIAEKLCTTCEETLDRLPGGRRGGGGAAHGASRVSVCSSRASSAGRSTARVPEVFKPPSTFGDRYTPDALSWRIDVCRMHVLTTASPPLPTGTHPTPSAGGSMQSVIPMRIGRRCCARSTRQGS